MIKIDNPQNCCGCTACASVCPRKAITMQPDALGFLYPQIDKDICTNCGLCEKVCTFNENYEKSSDNILDVYAVRHKDIKEIEKSRSGAMFVAITDYILENNGVIYGAGYSDHFRVTHKRATTAKERDEFRGSKYVQSDLGDTFSQVAYDLKEELLVCFSGTPCQVAGLRSFLKIKKIDTDKLIVVDIVCHGTPSPYIWRDYLAYIEKKHKGKATEVSFREKKVLGWVAHKESFTINGEKIITNTYTNLFYKHIMLRHSCAVCHYTNTERCSDITLADFWGWEKADEQFNIDNKGVSLVLVNSEKGKKLLTLVSRDIDIKETTIQIARKLNHPLNTPSTANPNRDKFERDYARKGFLHIIKKYSNQGLVYQIERRFPIIGKIRWNITNRMINKLWKRKK